MTPNYVAKKSAVAALSFWLIIFCWLVIPLIIQIVRILSAKNFSIEFYDDKKVVKSGVLSKNEDQSVFSGVYSVSVHQSFFGRIFKYGDVAVDAPGTWDIKTEKIKDPQSLKRYLETRISSKGTVNIFNN